MARAVSSGRLALEGDLSGLLALFAASEVSLASADPEAIWVAMLKHPGLSTFLVEEHGIIVATASLISAPNLLREGRGHGFLENVVTHSQHRGRGFGRVVVRAALDHAWSQGCHHVLMQSGRADPRVHRFYEMLGFRPGLRRAYVALAPVEGATKKIDA